MLINEILVKNYKPLVKAYIKPSKELVVFYGHNAGGKSSMIEAMLLTLRCTYGIYEEIFGKDLEEASIKIASSINRFIKKTNESISMSISSKVNLLGENITLEISASAKETSTTTVPYLTELKFRFKLGDEVYENIYSAVEGTYIKLPDGTVKTYQAPPPLSKSSLIDPNYYIDLKHYKNILRISNLVNTYYDTEEKLKTILNIQNNTLSNIVEIITAHNSLSDIYKELINIFIRDLEYGREFIIEYLDALNYIVEDFEINDIIFRENQIFIKQKTPSETVFSLKDLSSGLIRLMYILLKIFDIIYFKKYKFDIILKQAKINTENIKPILFIENFENSLHVDWIENFVDWISVYKPEVQIVAETHSGLVISSALSRNYDVYYFEKGFTEKITKENVAEKPMKLFRREQKVMQSILLRL